MKLFILFTVLTNSLLVFGQTERSDVELPKIQITPTKVLSKAKGYSLDESGQWRSAQNKIPFPKETYDEIDNFVSYDLRDVKINDTLYYLFMKKYNTGWHTYPTLMEGWNSTISAEWFVIERKEIDSLIIISDSINLIRLNPIHHGWIDNAPLHRKWNNTTYVSEIQKDISKKILQKEKYSDNLIFHVAPYKAKGIVRFNFYTMSTYNSAWMITNEYQPKDPSGKYGIEELKIFGSNTLFSYCYYETDLVSFQKLLTIK